MYPTFEFYDKVTKELFYTVRVGCSTLAWDIFMKHWPDRYQNYYLQAK